MAIYHLSMQVISRSKGQSAVASAAYRSGEQLVDERTGEIKHYQRETDPETMILAPENSPEWVYDRNRLWNEVEGAEKRKDSQLAREINIALPNELSNEQQKELIQEFAQKEFVDKGMVADIAIHRDDLNNPHAHVMLTMRTIDENGFGKKNREWNADFANSKQNERGYVKSSEQCLDIREQWANHANKALEQANVNERISHLSHDARGLEQLPTVHLGHVANEMEKRGVQTDRGDLNRDREEYNAQVIDLQKYREEKQALEQTRARQQEQKAQQAPYTSGELVHLKEASKLLKGAEPTLANIDTRREQLDKWENRIDNNSAYLRWKTEKLQEATQLFGTIQVHEKGIQHAQERLDTIKWANPLKFKENRITKEQAEQDIARAKSGIAQAHEKLGYHREKLGFQSEAEFKQVKGHHEKERPERNQSNQNARLQIKYERETLQKAEKAHQSRFIRQMASKYPEQLEMAYMSLQTAKHLEKINKEAGRVVPLEKIESVQKSQKQAVQGLESDINRVQQEKGRLQRAGVHLKNYEKQQGIVDKYEKNPVMKGKTLVSKTAKREYQEAVSGRDHFKKLMNAEGVSGKADFTKQTSDFSKMEEKMPALKEKLNARSQGMGLLDALVNGLDQANKTMEQATHRQEFNKQKSKSRVSKWDLER